MASSGRLRHECTIPALLLVYPALRYRLEVTCEGAAMDQLAGPVPASLDQAVGSVIEDGRANWPRLMQTREPEAAPALADLTDTGRTPVYQPSAPPAPAWLLRQRTRRPSRRPAVLALAALTLAAIALAWTSVALALKGLGGDPAGSRAAAGELIYPAPPTAAR